MAIVELIPLLPPRPSVRFDALDKFLLMLFIVGCIAIAVALGTSHNDSWMCAKAVREAY